MSPQNDFIDSLKTAFKGLRKKTRRIPKQAHDLKEALDLLKKREKQLQKKLEKETDEDAKKRLQHEIKIVHQQRENGLQLLKGVHSGEELPPL